MATKIKTTATKKLKSRFRFVILNDETFEEKFSLTLTRRNVWVFLSVSAFTLIFFTASVIIYTPLKYFIPGFGDYNYRSQIIQLQFQADSLQTALDSRAAWLENVMNIATGQIDSNIPATKAQPTIIDKSSINISDPGKTEKDLRKLVDEEESYLLAYNDNMASAVIEEVRLMHPISPVDGFITDEHSTQQEHYGIDIATKSEAPIRSILDGNVILAYYTIETGYVIQVQHSNDLISIYKHNSKLMKKAGDRVKAGDVIALAGGTGEYSTGVHLHFEMWHNGKSLNPQDYIVF